MFELIEKGGIFIYPILACSVVALGVFMERMVTLRRSRVMPREFLIEVEDYVKRQLYAEAQTSCTKSASPLSNVLAVALSKREQPVADIRDALEEAGRVEVSNLERYVEAVGVIGSICPLLGLLGTVTGMIKAFSVISLQGVGNPSQLAAGISEALICTAAGLSVAVPAVILYKILVRKVDTLAIELETNSSRLLDRIKAPQAGQ